MPQLDLRIARLLLIANAFGCLEDGATIAAGLAAHQDAYVQPFVKPVIGEDKVFAKMRTDWEFAVEDVKHFAPKLGRALETGVQSAPITVLRLYQDFVATRDEEGRDSAKELAQAEYASAKRLHQMDLTRQDLLRRLKKEGFGKKETKKLSAAAASFVPGGMDVDEEEEAEEDSEERAGGGQGVAIGGGGDADGATSALAGPPSEDELLFKAIIAAAFSPNYAVGFPGPQRKIRVDGFDLARTVIYRLQRSVPLAVGGASAPPAVAPHGGPEDYTINMAAFQTTMEQCCYSEDPPRLVLRTVGQDQFLAVEFPSEHAALLGLRILGIRKQLAVFGGPRAPGGGLPLLSDPVYSRKLAFTRPAHKTEMDYQNGESRGHMVEMHWQSACAMLHTPANGDEGDDDGKMTAGGALGGRRYLVTTGFQRAGVSKNRLLAMHPTLLSGHPMVAELTMLLFAREASWLISTTTPGNVFKTELAGAEVGTGDDSITLIFTTALTEADVLGLNEIRATLSTRMGAGLGAATESDGDGDLRTKLSTRESSTSLPCPTSAYLGLPAAALVDSFVLVSFAVLLADRPLRTAEPPKPWRRVTAASLIDWDSLWSPLSTLADTTAEVERQLLSQETAKKVASRATNAESIW